MEEAERAPITDSPWFWVLMFSLVGLLALVVIGGKYSRRQAAIERQYQARERVAEKLTAENNPNGAARIESSDARRAYATPGDDLVPLWPLAVLLGLVSVAAAVMLYRARRRMVARGS
jgi:hypothetical protein